MDAEVDYLIDKAASLLRGAHHVVALTGAGISTSSGIPDFRSVESGLWNDPKAMMSASIVGFRSNPESFFEWMRPLAQKIVDAQPNPAHEALSRLEGLGILKALITQNIDILHSRAGSRNVFEVHGHMREATCIECYHVVPADGLLDAYLQHGQVPHCPHCGGILKPNVILLGEQLPFKVLQGAEQAARDCDVMLVAGSSLLVAPVSDLPLLAYRTGARVIVVNYEQTYIDKDADVVIHDNVATVLPRIVEQLEKPQ